MILRVQKKDESGEPIGILDLYGFASGRMGMCMHEFCLLRPEEFESAARCWIDHYEQQRRDRWERMRMQTALMLQPFVREKLTPDRLLRFSWDKRRRDQSSGTESGLHSESMSIQERRERALEALRRIDGV